MLEFRLEVIHAKLNFLFYLEKVMPYNCMFCQSVKHNTGNKKEDIMEFLIYKFDLFHFCYLSTHANSDL